MKIVYIVGAGHSGTTIFDLLVGANEDCFSCGELLNMLDGYREKGYCSCNVELCQCEFWSQVVKNWKNITKLSEKDITEFAKMDRIYSHPKKLRAWLSAILPRYTTQHRRYLKILQELVNQVFIVSGVNVICDSSKSPVRLMQLIKAIECEIQAIHLVKEPYSVIASMLRKNNSSDNTKYKNKSFKSNPIRTAIWWTVINIMAEVAIRVKNLEYSRVRYEELVTSPEVSLCLVSQDLKYSPPLCPGHLAEGNRLRMQERIIIENKFLNNTLLKGHYGFLVDFILLPLRKRYKYTDAIFRNS